MKNNIQIKTSAVQLSRLYERYKDLNHMLILCKYEGNDQVFLDILLERRKVRKSMKSHHNSIRKQLGVKNANLN